MKYKFIETTKHIKGVKDNLIVLCVNPQSERLSCMYKWNQTWNKVWEDPSNRIVREKRLTLYYKYMGVK